MCFFLVFIYLAALGLGCGTRDLCCGMQGLLLGHTNSVAPRHVGSQFPDQGSNLCPLYCKVKSHWTTMEVIKMEFRLNICKVQRIQQPRELAELVFYIPKLPFFYPSMCCAVLCLVTQSCLTLCNPWPVARQAPLSMGILQARILEWVAMSSSRGSYQPRDRTQVSDIA